MIAAAWVLLVAACGSIPSVRAEGEQLQLEIRPNGITFQLVGSAESTTWLLQHSPDGLEWKDLAFLQDRAAGMEEPGVDILWGALPQPATTTGFFRAMELEEDDPLRRRLLEERTKWRLSGFDDYQYELRQNFGQISWHGTVDIIDHEVQSFETIELQPPFIVDPPPIPSIEGLFDRIANAIAADAEEIQVTWHPDFGYPSSCSIDFSTLIADEEQGWMIEAFTPWR